LLIQRVTGCWRNKTNQYSCWRNGKAAHDKYSTSTSIGENCANLWTQFKKNKSPRRQWHIQTFRPCLRMAGMWLSGTRLFRRLLWAERACGELIL
jgi:hypothetical protein